MNKTMNKTRNNTIEYVYAVCLECYEDNYDICRDPILALCKTENEANEYIENIPDEFERQFAYVTKQIKTNELIDSYIFGTIIKGGDINE